MPQTALRLTERDYDLLDALADYRFLTVPQTAALFFPSPDAAARRLRQLVRARLASTVFMTVRAWDRRTETVYALAARGSELLRPRRHGLRPKHLSAREQRSALYLEHTLHRNDVRIALERLQELDPQFALLAWQQAPEQVGGSAVVRVGVRAEARVPAVPDGVALVRYAGVCQVLAFEVDRGTVPIRRMWRRYRAYWKMFRLGATRLRYGPAPFRVLTFAPDQKRIAALVEAARTAPETGAYGSKLFWFAPLATANIRTPTALLAPTWQVAHARITEPQPLFANTLIHA